MRTILFAVLVTIVGTSAASAFTVTAGFTASVYATAAASAGVTFVGTTLYAVDPATGGLYRAASGTPPLTATLIATLSGAPTGIAMLGGSLYVTRAAFSDVVRVDPATGAILSIVATPADISCASAIAADPVTGDLFVTSCDAIWRIASPATAPAVSFYTELFPGGASTYGITISADDTIFVTAPGLGQVWRIQGPTQAAGLPPVKGPIAYLVAPRGVTQIGSYLFVNGGDGSITKVALPELGIANVVALAGGDPGDLASLGPDGCVYASQGPAVIRLGDATGGCDLAHAAPPPPPPSLTLANTSTTPPLIGGGDQTFTASLANVASPGGVSVTFTVTGANPLTRTTTTGPNGIASFAYSATTIGTDTVVAVATVSGAPLISNTVLVTWPRALDTAAPTISYTYTGTPGATFGCPRAGVGVPGVTEYCGWFITPPTLTWTITPNGPSGIDLARTSCPPFALVGSSPIAGTPVTCIAYNGDGVSASLQVVLQAIAAPPSISASATAGGVPYVAGTPIAQPVTVMFACDSAYGAAGVVSCTAPVTVSASTASVTGTVVDVAGTVRTASFGPIVITTQASSLQIVSPAFLAEGSPVRAKLVGVDGVTPVVGRTVTFSAGGLSTTGVTDAQGIATASLALAPGEYSLTAMFAGDAAYFASHASQSAVVYATTRFVAWGPNAVIGAIVQLYGSDWSKQIADKDLRKTFEHFKGYAATASGGVWTGKAGDKTKAPSTIARYVAVIVTAAATRSGDELRGTIDALAIVRVDASGKKAFDGRVGDAVFGTVLGVVAP